MLKRIARLLGFCGHEWEPWSWWWMRFDQPSVLIEGVHCRKCRKWQKRVE